MKSDLIHHYYYQKTSELFRCSTDDEEHHFGFDFGAVSENSNSPNEIRGTRSTCSCALLSTFFTQPSYHSLSFLYCTIFMKLYCACSCCLFGDLLCVGRHCTCQPRALNSTIEPIRSCFLSHLLPQAICRTETTLRERARSSSDPAMCCWRV